MINIQDEAMKIHHQYGMTEKANYEIQLLAEKYAKEYHKREVENLGLFDVRQQRELFVCGDLLKHNFSISKIGECIKCKHINNKTN